MSFKVLAVDSFLFLTFTSLLLQLGVGTLWTTKGLSDSGAPPCAYGASTLASMEYQALSDCPASTAIPIEEDFSQGSYCGHWDELCFGKYAIGCCFERF